VAKFKESERGFEDSVRRVIDELGIPKISAHKILNSQLGMRKVCTRSVLKFLTPLQHVNPVDCCQELLQEREADPTNFFARIVIGDEFWVYHYDPLSQLEAKAWKKPGEQTPTRTCQERSAGKIMMIIFWNKHGVLLIDYLPRGITINGPSWRNAAANLAMKCCFFMTTPPFTSAALCRLLFDRLASSN
jgi:predicted NAD/FAD-binding protein